MGLKPRTPRARATLSARQSGMTVDAYIAKLPATQAKLARELRVLVTGSGSGITETVKWGQPVFECCGPFAYFRGSGRHLTFGFWRGAELRDAHGLLEGTGGKMRHVKLPHDAPLPVAALHLLVRQAVVLNRSERDPTRRS
jgi:hypothetical protein